MSVSRSFSESKAIPRRMFITDPSQLPNEYSSTPGGTLYSTTPGGTKIVYDRSFLMNLRNSPISQTPPKCNIPSGLVRGSVAPHAVVGNCIPSSPTIPVATIEESAEQFAMDL